MSDKPKLHVYMGAPPPFTILPGPEAKEVEEEEESWPGRWKHVALCWQGGKLRPVASAGGSHGSLSLHHQHENQKEREERRKLDIEADQSTLLSSHQVYKSNTDKDSLPAEESSPGQADQSQSEKEDLTSQPKQNLAGQDEKSDADKEPPCSASIHEYLDSCFPADSEPLVDMFSRRSVSVQTEYLAAWAVSQTLLMGGKKGIQTGDSPEKTPPKHHPTTIPQPSAPTASSSSPELYSPVPPTPPCGGQNSQLGSMELFSEPVEEGGVIFQTTPDGLLCSQAREQQEVCRSKLVESRLLSLPQSPPQCPHHKKTCISPAFGRKETAPPPADATSIRPTSSTTLLAQCVRPGGRYSVLVAVVHPCHLKEVKVRSGVAVGSSVPLVSLVVTDQSAVETKVVLWRRAAFWALTLHPGDILLITGVEVKQDKWRGETLLQSTYSSRLLHAGQLTNTSSPSVPHSVSAHVFSSLCEYLRTQRPLMVSLPPRLPQNLSCLPYALLRNLRANMLVHALLLVTHTHTITEMEGQFKSGVVLKAVLSVEQADGHQGVVVLWGAALKWLPQINKNKAAVWDFRVLLVRDGLISDLRELHSTPWGSIKPLLPDDKRVLEFYQPKPDKTATAGLELDLHTLLSQKYCGVVELRVHITAFQFQSSPTQNVPQQPLDSSTPLDRILDRLRGDVTYAGCGRCAAELDMDVNGIYSPCYPCLPHTTVRRYYRPVMLTVRESESQMCVQVSPVLIQRILLNTPPDKLHKTVSPDSEVRQVQRVAERIQSLLSLPLKTFSLTVRSHFLCDENSIPTMQDFLLLDFQCLGK
ncbi:shieldin complex subunit 2 [Lampris incognitus]|uniref:shieldin complex subunit 2 n=1 Tax=Lampris incognitus TaxID=2546036 RepID=UPI0024B62C1A|nr:shieldin complex subunit 2 [Lampris incognitus]